MEKLIRVTGEGEVALAPDTIKVMLRVEEVDKNYQKSLSKVNDSIEEIKKALIKVGVNEKNIITKGFNVRQKTKSVRDLNGNYKYEFEGYETVHNLVVEIPFDTNLLGDVVEAISYTLKTPQLNIAFSVENQEGLKEKLLEKAVKNAKADAEVLAMASGVKLGGVKTINHSFSEVHVYPPQSYQMESDMCKAKASVGSSLSSINVEEIKFNATVTIDYEIL